MPDAVLLSSQETERTPLRSVIAAVLSAAAHGAAFSLLSSGLIHVPKVLAAGITERYSVRKVNLHTPDTRRSPQPGDSSGGSFEKPGEQADNVLLQPEFQAHSAIDPHVPLPTFMAWTPELASPRTIVPPLPDQPTSIEAPPSFEAPNLELNAVEHPMAAADVQARIPLTSGTTSPLTLHTTSVLRMAPSSVSRSANQPTPTAVLSLSQVRMVEGTIVLPPVNRNSELHGTTTGFGKSGNGQETPSNANTAHVADPPGMTHITLARDGHFGFVAIGTSIADDYPETLPLWNNRVAYSVYLHVGLSKNWMLQYAVTQADDAGSGGVNNRLEAPWAYDIFRPNLISSDLNADALILHGILTERGRLESLEIAFPQKFAQEDLVLDALRRWQFRPARHNGKPVAVEVLLIIPDQDG